MNVNGFFFFFSMEFRVYLAFLVVLGVYLCDLGLIWSFALYLGYFGNFYGIQG